MWLMGKSILKSSLDIFKAMLNKFLFDLDDHIFVSGIHELTHMIDSIIQFGNPNNLNLMQFEELNRTVTRSINGQDLVGDEYIRNVNVAKNLIFHINTSPEFSSRTSNKSFLDFIMKNAKIRSSNLKKKNSKHLITIGKEIKIDIDEFSLYERDFFIKFCFDNENLNFYENIKFNNILYNTTINF